MPTGYSVPSTTINTLANIIAACINTSGGVAGDMSACGDLFSDATPSGGTAPTNVVNALLNILNNPTANLTPLENLAGTTTPFQPSLTSPPTTWAVELADTAATWTGGGDGVWRRDANSIYGEAYTFDPCNATQPGSGEFATIAENPVSSLPAQRQHHRHQRRHRYGRLHRDDGNPRALAHPRLGL